MYETTETPTDSTIDVNSTVTTSTRASTIPYKNSTIVPHTNTTTTPSTPVTTTPANSAGSSYMKMSINSLAIGALWWLICY